MGCQEKLQQLQDVLLRCESVLVAYSGGVDSAFVAKVACFVLGEKAVAVTALSPSFPSYEWEQARLVAQQIGIRHLTVETHELDNPRYRENRGDRCYFCKTELYALLKPTAEQLGLRVIANGTNLDDLSDFRPGLKAASEAQILSPLVEVGLTKTEVRQLSQEIGLSIFEKPAQACLSSRFPVGTEVTPERLSRIDRIESGLARIGFKTFRVRFHDPIARIEVGEEEISRFADPSVRKTVMQLCQQNGFAYATLDLAGYRYGNLNPLPLRERGG